MANVFPTEKSRTSGVVHSEPIVKLRTSGWVHSEPIVKLRTSGGVHSEPIKKSKQYTIEVRFEPGRNLSIFV